jgi:hypothetical protein
MCSSIVKRHSHNYQNDLVKLWRGLQACKEVHTVLIIAERRACAEGALVKRRATLWKELIIAEPDRNYHTLPIPIYPKKTNQCAETGIPTHTHR